MQGTGIWQIQSDTRKTGALSLGITAVGLVFLVLTRDAATRDARAAFWLGILLTAIGIAALIFMEDLTTTVDPGRKVLHQQRRSFWFREARVLPFQAVASAGVVKVGSGSEGTPSYFLVLDLKDGTRLGTGRWSTDPGEMDDLAEALAAQIGCALRPGTPRPVAAAARHLLVAALGAVVLYGLWYRLFVGPWCPAMAFGTAPPVFLLATFGILLGLLRRFWR